MFVFIFGFIAVFSIPFILFFYERYAEKLESKNKGRDKEDKWFIQQHTISALPKMNNLKKLITIIIRLQALGFVLQAIAMWATILIGILVASLQAVPSEFANYGFILMTSIVYLIIGLILYARSKSLASYFISGFQDEESTPQD